MKTKEPCIMHLPRGHALSIYYDAREIARLNYWWAVAVFEPLDKTGRRLGLLVCVLIQIGYCPKRTI